MAKYQIFDSATATLTTTAASIQAATGITKRDPQRLIVQVPAGSANSVLIGGPTTQVFELAVGSSITLGDLLEAPNRTQVDPAYVFVKAKTGTASINILFDRMYEI